MNQTRRNINRWILECIHMYIVGMFHNSFPIDSIVSSLDTCTVWCLNRTLNQFCVQCDYIEYWCMLLVHITYQNDHHGLLINLILFILSHMTVT